MNNELVHVSQPERLREERIAKSALNQESSTIKSKENE